MSISRPVGFPVSGAVGAGLSDAFGYDGGGVTDISGINWVQFGTNSFLHRTANLTGIFGGVQRWAVSAWLWSTADGIDRNIFAAEAPGGLETFSHSIAINDQILAGRFLSQDQLFNIIQQFNAGSTTVKVADGPTHLLWLFDKTQASANQIRVYKDGVLIFNGPWDNTTQGLPTWGTKNWHVGSHHVDTEPPANSQTANLKLGALWMDGGSVTRVLPTIADFYNEGVAVDVGAGGLTPTGTCLMYFDQRDGQVPDDFKTNKGTGGAFVLTGSIGAG